MPTAVPASGENMRYNQNDQSTPLGFHAQISHSKFIETEESNSDGLVRHR